MKTILKSISLLILVITLSANIEAQKTLQKIVKNGEIKIGMTLSQPPYNMRSKTWETIGYEVDLANILAESMGVKLTIVELPFHELLPSLETGKIDAVMSGMSITPERNLKAAFVGPYMISGKSIITKSSALVEADESEDIDKSHLKIAVLKGSTSENFVNNYIKNATVIRVENYKDGVNLLKEDNVDAMVADYIICLLAELAYPESGIQALEEPLTIEPIGMALPANDPLLMNLIDNYFNTLMVSGLLDELQQFWFEDGSWVDQMKDIKMAPQPTSGPIY